MKHKRPIAAHPHTGSTPLSNRITQFSPAGMRVLALTLSAIFTVTLIRLFGFGLSSIEERVGALGWTLKPDSAPEQRVVLVVIDENSIAEVGPWPWSRNDMALLVSAIDAAGAQLQICCSSTLISTVSRSFSNYYLSMKS